MGRIEIPKRMENQFKTLVICLRALTRPENMVLAGGTTLEMLWKHRDSTDIDLFVSNRTLIEISQAGKEAKTRGNRSTKGQNSERPAAESGSRDAEMNTLEIVGLALCNRVVEMHLEKACAGMRIDHPERMESIGSRIRENRLEDEDKAVLRWAISGMRDGDVKSMLAWGGIQAKEFFDRFADEARDIRTRRARDADIVAKLIFRTYQKHQNDEWTSRSLDLIDRLCLERIHDAGREFEQFER